MMELGELLIGRGLITPSELARAREIMERMHTRLPATLVRLGLVAEPDLLDACLHLSGLPRADRASPGEAAAAIPGVNRRYLLRHAIAPLASAEKSLVLAMADPFDEEAVQAMAFAMGGGEISRAVATFSDIETLIGPEPAGGPDLPGIEADVTAGALDDLERMAEGESEAPVIRLVQRLLANAVLRRASDVHIEPMARHVSVRYRVDGRLIEVEQLPDATAAPLASRVKVLSGLDIAESRLPQDGRLKLTVRGRNVDVRVSTSPTSYGESIVLRLLGRSEVPLELERLGLPGTGLAKLGRALAQPHGIILLTGPTGSGKTTTLYAAINRLSRPDVKILTVEDPVEVLLDGINQVQVKPEIGLSYATALRAFLRQDPDILMIGEIRDQETAEIATRAALTGHLVLSTLHTNSAIGAFTRLQDIGVEPYLTASTVIATIAQRLIRRLCPDCRSPRDPSASERSAFEHAGIGVPDRLHDAVGCDRCELTGFRGRMPLIEIFEVDERAREFIREGTIESIEDLRPKAETLLGHGLQLAARAETSLAEVERAVQLT